MAKIMIAMSGGVDSAAAAILLAREGHDVAGVTMRLFDAPWARPAAPACAATTRPSRRPARPSWRPARPSRRPARPSRRPACCSPEAMRVAQETARRIGVDHYVLDFRREFEEVVINDFVNEYKSGRTPNPCVRCNTFVKFDLLLRRALSTGFDGLATGHYAKLNRGKTVLSRAVDRTKDQTYFLWGTPAESLAYLYFPVGDYTKKEIRAIARGYLPDADARPESQDICFVGEDVGAFLSERISSSPGPVTDVDGNVLGAHGGLGSHTVGRRRGVGVATGERVYVRELVPAENRLVVAPAQRMFASALVAAKANWLAEAPAVGESVTALVRYRDRGARAYVEADGGRLVVRFVEPRRAITPGQSVVFYRGDVLVGGAIIESVSWDV